MTIEEMARAADLCEEVGARVCVVVQSQTRPGSNPRRKVAPGLIGEIIDRHFTGDYYALTVALEVADVRAFIARATPQPEAGRG